MTLHAELKKSELDDIPEKWKLLQIKDISKVRRGSSPRPIDNPKYFGNGRGWIRIADVTKSNKYLKKTKDYLSELGESKSVPVNPGDLIMSIAASVGKPIIVKMNACIHDGFVFFSNLSDDIDVEFLYYLLTTFQDKFGNVGQHGTQKNLNIEIVSNTKFLKPPIREQQKIASILSGIDELIQKTDEIIEQSQMLRRGLIQRLLTRGTRTTKFKKVKSLFGRYTEIPIDWDIKTFDELFKFLRNGTNSRDDLEESGDIQYIHYGDIHAKWHSVLNCDVEKIPYIDEEKVRELPLLQDGDLIIADASEDYEGSGASVLLRNVRSRKIVSGLHTIPLRSIDKNIIPEFKTYLNSIKFVKNQIVAYVTGISVYGLSKNNLKKIKIPLPPIEEQQKIATILTDVDCQIKKQLEYKSKLKSVKKGLMQKLLTGKLRVTI